MKRRILILLTLTLLFSLAGCDSSNYKKAMSMYDNGQYEEAAVLFEKLGDYEDSASMLESCKKEAMFQTYKDVLTALVAEPWYFNGGSDTTLNQLTFTKDGATLAQVYFDGNGKHENGSSRGDYLIDDDVITITVESGSELVIPYTIEGSILTLGNGDYYSETAVNAALQGCWTFQDSLILSGEMLHTAYSILIENGKLVAESAVASANSAPGTYNYAGPHEGTYTLNFGGFETDMRHGHAYFFNIVDGKVTLFHYDNALSPTDSGLPGINGYSF